MKFITNLLKACDTYRKELSIPTNNSVLRGLINLVVALLFIAFNIYIILDNINNQKIKEIATDIIVDTDMVDISKLHLEFNIKFTEYFFTTEDISSCSNPYMQLNSREKIYFKKIENPAMHDEQSFILNYNFTLSNYSEKKIYSFIIANDCILNTNVKSTVINFDYLQNITNNKLNIKGKTSEEIYFSKKINDEYNFPYSKVLGLYEISSYISLNLMHEDYKSYLDFNKYSSNLLENYQQKTKSFFNPKIYLFNYDLINAHSFEPKDKNNDNLYHLIYYTFETGNTSKVSIRVYNHFLYLFPTIVSVATTFMNAFMMLNSVLTYHYKFHEFINNNCRIKYPDIIENNRNSINESSKFTSNINISQNNFHSDSNNSNKLDKSKLTVKSITKIDSDGNSNDQSLIEKEKPFSCNQSFSSREDYKEKKDTYDFLKYIIKDSFCFSIPFAFCRSKIANTKLKILNDVKTKLYEDETSFYFYTSNVTTYLINRNLMDIYGKNILLKPIFEYNLKDYE